MNKKVKKKLIFRIISFEMKIMMINKKFSGIAQQ